MYESLHKFAGRTVSDGRRASNAGGLSLWPDLHRILTTRSVLEIQVGVIFWSSDLLIRCRIELAAIMCTWWWRYLILGRLCGQKNSLHSPHYFLVWVCDGQKASRSSDSQDGSILPSFLNVEIRLSQSSSCVFFCLEFVRKLSSSPAQSIRMLLLFFESFFSMKMSGELFSLT